MLNDVENIPAAVGYDKNRHSPAFQTDTLKQISF
jgi:hypothetical protein